MLFCQWVWSKQAICEMAICVCNHWTDLPEMKFLANGDSQNDPSSLAM